MRFSFVVAAAVLSLGLTGCGQNSSDELLKRIAASAKENADTSKQILAALNDIKGQLPGLKPGSLDPIVAAVLKVEGAVGKVEGAVGKVEGAVGKGGKRAALAIPYRMMNGASEMNPSTVCQGLGYTDGKLSGGDSNIGMIICFDK